MLTLSCSPVRALDACSFAYLIHRRQPNRGLLSYFAAFYGLMLEEIVH
jgi:hypothetical protein